MNETRPESPFGRELRQWRQQKGLSQLRLASAANMSPRYVSFIETGRSRPSRTVVERLADTLGVPLRARNQLLLAAGIAAAYPEGSLDEPVYSPFARIVDSLLRKQEPYPAFVIDRSYQLLKANDAGYRVLPALRTTNWIDACFAPESQLRLSLENFGEVAWGAADLLRKDCAAGGPALQENLSRLERHLRGVPRPAPEADSRALIARYRFGDRRVQTLTTIARFGAARDVTLDELRVELVFPADEESARFFEELAASS